MSTPSPVRAEIIVVGTELLRGGRLDRNGPFLLRELGRMGFEVTRVAIVPDETPSIAADVRAAIGRAIEVIIVCGGLGPTRDDVTREAIAASTGVPLAVDDAALADVRARAATFGDSSEETARRQAMVFRGGRWFGNTVGVAPALALTHGPSTLFLLPGPPGEMQEMFRRTVQRELAARVPCRATALVRTVGVREVEVSGMVDPLLTARPDVSVSYLPQPATVDVVISSCSRPVTDLLAAMRKRLGARIYAEDERSLEEVVEQLLVSRGARLVTAESCTGGLVGEILTSVPGSSRCFHGGVVVYSNELKERLLGVPKDLLQRYGAVSEEVARAMARGARERLGAEWALSITGIAGPEGGSPDKPVGLVFCGLAGPDGECRVERHGLGGDRAAVRLASARLALDLLRRRLRA